MAQHTLEGDRRLRQMAPPVDWEAVAAEGAQQLRKQWWQCKPAFPWKLDHR